jgi:hypothetical protein
MSTLTILAAMNPWPYSDEEEPSSYRPPTWHCPEGLCECTPADHQQSAHFAVQLCNEFGERMAGARYRIRRGREVMVDSCADTHGWAIVELSHPSRSVRIEWAPGDTPASPRFPFRERYVVKVASHAPEQANLHRLHNLGFHSWMYAFRNVRSFNQRYGLVTNDEELASIEPSLKLFHDEALLPVVSPTGELLPTEPSPPPPLQPAGLLQPPPPAVFLTLVDTSSGAVGATNFVLHTLERKIFGRTENDGGLPFDIYQLGVGGRVTLQVTTKDAGAKELEVPLDIPQRPGRYTLWLQSWYP